MSKIVDMTSEPIKVSLPNGTQQTIRQRLVTYRAETDQDMVEITEEMLKGRDILLNANGYIMLREIVPLKVDLSTKI